MRNLVYRHWYPFIVAQMGAYVHSVPIFMGYFRAGFVCNTKEYLAAKTYLGSASRIVHFFV